MSSPADEHSAGPPIEAGRSVPSSFPLSPREAIEAEIADHLASAAEALQDQGTPRGEALRLAHARFGDVESIRRRCYWVQQGDTIMFRTVVVLFLVCLAVGLVVSAVGTWHSQSRLTEQVALLSEQLKLLAEKRQEGSPAPEQPLPPQIVGRVFAGTPDKPVADKEVIVVDVKEGNIVRRVLSDPQGQFRSGPLADGDYALVAKLESPVALRYPYLQTEPFYIHQALGEKRCDLDVAYHAGRLRLEISRPLPRREVPGRYTIDSRLLVSVIVPRMSRYLRLSTMNVPQLWPLFIRSPVAPYRRTQSKNLPSGSEIFSYNIELFELLGNEDLEKWHATLFDGTSGLMPAGKVQVSAALLVDVLPPRELLEITMIRSDYTRLGLNPEIQELWWEELRKPWWNKGGLFRNDDTYYPQSFESDIHTTKDDDFFWATKGLGKRWYEHLTQPQNQPLQPAPYLIDWTWTRYGTIWDAVPIQDGQVTRLQIMIPADAEEKLAQFVEQTTDPELFLKRTLGGTKDDETRQTWEELAGGDSPFFRKVEITVAGFEPLPSQ